MSQYQPMYDSFDRSVPERYVPTARMSVSASVYLPGSDVDVQTGQLKPEHLRRRRVQSKRLEQERAEREEKRRKESLGREMNKGGVRIPLHAGVLCIAVLMFLCGVSLLARQGEIAELQKEINRLQNAITECRSQNMLLEEQIAEASDAAVICYAASQELNMIPAEAAEAIHLVAVDTRPMQNPAQENQLVVEMTLTAQEPQSTQIPVSASN